MLALPFLATLFAIIELGLVTFDNEMLSSAVSAASRSMMTGSAQAANISTSAQFISAYLCPATGKRLVPTSFDCSKLIVDVRPAASFLAGDMANDFYKSTSNEFCPGAPGQIVVMRVAYPLAAILPLDLMNTTAGVVNDVPGQTGFYHILMGEALFQEEAYTTGFTPPTGC